MNTRAGLTAAILVVGSFFFATPAASQRSGFIIGGGLGVGTVSIKSTLVPYGITDREARYGGASSLHIGWIVGNSLELYLMTHVVWHEDPPSTIEVPTGMIGIGATYPLSSDISIKGAIGRGIKDGQLSSLSNMKLSDLGLLAGGRYGLSDRLAIDLDIVRAGWKSGGSPSSEGSWWGLGLTVNLLSH